MLVEPAVGRSGGQQDRDALLTRFCELSIEWMHLLAEILYPKDPP